MLKRPHPAPPHFSVLGPLEVRAASGVLDIGGHKQRSLLAVLLLNANRMVPVDHLIDELWPGATPKSAKNSVQGYISRLRRILGGQIVTESRGYSIRVEPEKLDLAKFDRLVELGRHALGAGDPALAAARLREALALWRGEPLADVKLGPSSEIEAARLDERRLTALEERIEADLTLSRQAEVLDELEGLVARHPLRERFRRQLMIVLYRCGRQAEALDLYREMRKALIAELGIEPSPDLQRLQHAILTQDPSLEVSDVPAGTWSQRVARKHVTVLHVSFKLLETDDPEVSNRAFSGFLEAATAILHRYEAVLDERPGEGVLATFGLPAAHEDDALRALRAAVELREKLPGSGIAIDSGTVLGSDRVVAGDALARVARLKSEVPSEEILLGDRARQLVRHVATATRAGRGIWRLVEVDQGAEAIQRHFEGTLVGRELELARLRQVLTTSVDHGRCQLFTVVGSAGIGKSRLFREFTQLTNHAATVLEGRCLPYGDGITYWPLVEMVRQAAGDSTRKAVRSLLGSERDAGLIAGQVAAAFGSEDADDAGEDTLWAFRRLFEMLAREQPLVLCFEDVHWAEPRLLDLIEHITDWSREAPILLLCLARTELLTARPTWGGGRPNAGSLLLTPLTEAESGELIDLRAKGTGEQERNRIIARAEGNPLFLEQMIALLGEGRGPTGPGLPPTIQAVLAARLDRLDRIERLALDSASVIGFEFWLGALVELTGEDRVELREALLRLVKRELIQPSRSELRSEEAFRFRHLLIRESAYESIPKLTRADLHAQLVGWLKTSLGGRSADIDELLGFHLEKAYNYRVELDPDGGDWERLASQAAQRFRSAGRRALVRSDMQAAADLLERSLRIWPERAPERGWTYLDLSPAYRATGRWKEAEGAIKLGLEIAERTRDEVLAVHLAVCHLELDLQLGTQPVHEIARQGELALSKLTRLGEGSRAPNAQILMAWAHALLGQATQAERVLETLLDSADHEQRVRLRAARLLPSQWLYGPTPAGAAIALCQRLKRDLSSLRELGAANRCMAVLKAMQGEFDAARELIREDSEMLEDLGLSVVAAGVSGVHSTVEILAGNLGRAEQMLTTGLERLGALGKTIHFPDVAATLARVLYGSGRYLEAEEVLELVDTRTSHDIAVPVSSQGTQAKLLARSGMTREGVTLAREAVALAERTDLLDLRGDSLMNLAEVLVLAGNEEGAREAAGAALGLYQRKGNEVSALRAKEISSSIDLAV